MAGRYESESVRSGLAAVAVISEHNAWAVGSSSSPSGFDQGLIEHWNGSDWEIVPSSAPVGTDLQGVVAPSKNDAWAVGTFFDSNNNTESLTEHWNGQAWQVIATPNPVNVLGPSLVVALRTRARVELLRPYGFRDCYRFIIHVDGIDALIEKAQGFGNG